MTNEIKNKILTLRDNGYGYKRISRISIEVSVPISFVRYICAVKNRTDEASGVCLNCG